MHSSFYLFIYPFLQEEEEKGVGVQMDCLKGFVLRGEGGRGRGGRGAGAVHHVLFITGNMNSTCRLSSLHPSLYFIIGWLAYLMTGPCLVLGIYT